MFSVVWSIVSAMICKTLKCWIWSYVKLILLPGLQTAYLSWIIWSSYAKVRVYMEQQRVSCPSWSPTTAHATIRWCCLGLKLEVILQRVNKLLYVSAWNLADCSWCLHVQFFGTLMHVNYICVLLIRPLTAHIWTGMARSSALEPLTWKSHSPRLIGLCGKQCQHTVAIHIFSGISLTLYAWLCFTFSSTALATYHVTQRAICLCEGGFF